MTDAVCQQLADNSSLVPNGTYVAWLSNSTVSARDRLEDSSTFRYLNLYGNVIAEGWDDLVDGALENGILWDETGSSNSGPAWTGTNTDGTSTTDNCNDWSSATSSYNGKTGYPGTVDSSWSGRFGSRCGLQNNLYCFMSSRMQEASSALPYVIEELEGGQAGLTERMEAVENQTAMLEGDQTGLTERMRVVENQTEELEGGQAELTERVEALETEVLPPAYAFVTSWETSGNINGICVKRLACFRRHASCLTCLTFLIQVG